MNKYLRDRLMGRDRRSQDYGRGDMARGSNRGRRGGDRGNEDYDYMDEEYRRGDSARSGRGGSRGGSNRGGNRGGRRGDRAGTGRGDYGYDMGYDDYQDYGDFEYNYDMRDMPMELHEKQIKKWEKELKNSDGSHGPKFSEDQIIPIAKQHGIEFEKDKFTEKEFTMAVNMLYADYCMALQQASFSNYTRPEPYVHMAKAFLCDEDFEGKPYEKLALYYYTIVEHDD